MKYTDAHFVGGVSEKWSQIFVLNSLLHRFFNLSFLLTPPANLKPILIQEN